MDLKDEEYNSASDQDFNPDAPRESDVESSSDDESSRRASKGQKRKVDDGELDFDNSGDEATLKKAHRKKSKKGSTYDNEDEAGDGGLIKTRAQRQAEVKEKKPLVQAAKPSVDVDSIWAQMTAGPKTTSNTSSELQTTPNPSKEALPQPFTDTEQDVKPKTLAREAQTSSHGHEKTGPENGSNGTSTIPANGETMITIKRSYEFAGEKIEEERIVSASSAEARVYLEAQRREKEQLATGAKQPALRRPMKRKSMFAVGVTDGATASPKASRLNTVEKSKLDWAAHVDKEGISEELDEHRKAKDTYLGRMDFLGRTDAKREEELRNARAK